MIKTEVAFLEGRPLFHQSETIKKNKKTSDWLEKVGSPKKPLLIM